ncbi:unnamed protein product [Lactuca virosa]|uniref:Nucleoplasmin-like domain-containing protein n=1 Tax=Lactuca virosa TaxID=75947 RepID=A0AAU9PA66_9ASTR|nr:unnamed protein product [Lactuca virosa]
MASWGCEVRAGERFVADIAEGTILVILKAYLGVPKEDIHEDSVSLYITVDGKKLVAGNFNPRRHSEQRLCLSIDKKFSLTHTLRDNSLYFFGVTHEKEPEDKKKDKPTVEEASSASVYSHRCKKYSIMSFWGAEVKHGQRLHVKLDQGNYLSLKLASLVCTGNHEEKKSVCLEVDTCDKTIQLARLHPERLPQQVMDLKPRVHEYPPFHEPNFAKNEATLASECARVCSKVKSMKFWGVEIKSGETISVKLDPENILHFRHASLIGIDKQTKEKNVTVEINASGRKHEITLNTRSKPQAALQKLYDEEIQLSHNFKDGKVYLLGTLTTKHGQKSGYHFLTFSQSDDGKEKERKLERRRSCSF